jgi:hypothetical protein
VNAYKVPELSVAYQTWVQPLEVLPSTIIDKVFIIWRWPSTAPAVTWAWHCLPFTR